MKILVTGYPEEIRALMVDAPRAVDSIIQMPTKPPTAYSYDALVEVMEKYGMNAAFKDGKWAVMASKEYNWICSYGVQLAPTVYANVKELENAKTTTSADEA